MSTRTTARGTAMTGVGCSALTLATAAVERPLHYDALMLTMADTGWRLDEQTNAGPSGRGASLGASGVSHGMIAPHTVSGGSTANLPGCGRPHSVASNPKVGEAGATALGNLADDCCRSCLRFQPRDSNLLKRVSRGGASSMHPQQRNSIEMSAPCESNP